MGLLRRTTRSTRRPRARALGASAALLGVLLMSSGAALLATAGSAGATTAATECVPSEAYLETVHVPATYRTVHVEAVTHVVEHPAVAAVPDVWQNFSPNRDQGTFTGPPSWPTDSRGTWEHQGKSIPPGQAGPDGVYQNGQGNGSWFYRHAGSPAVPASEETVVDEPAKDISVLDTPAHDMFVPHPAVTCDDETTVCEEPSTIVEGVCTPPSNPQCEEGQVLQGETCVTPPTGPVCEAPSTLVEGVCTVADPPNEPTVVTPPTTPTATTVTPAKTTTTTTKVKATKTASTPAATTTIPTVVHAGLAGDVVDAAGSHTQQGIALLVAGALVLLAGGLGMTRRTGAHARS
jgi:hypothetical protein